MRCLDQHLGITTRHQWTGVRGLGAVGKGGRARIWASRSHSEGLLVPPLLWLEGREAVESGWSLPGPGEKLASESEAWRLGQRAT